MSEISIAYNNEYLSLGVKKPIKWDPDKAPHIVIIGSTGSGKTYFSKFLLGKISLYLPDAKLTVCDFKGDEDFLFLAKCPNFFRYDNCIDGFNQFYSNFRKRQNNEDKSRNALVLFFDEWASYCNSQEKKKLEEEKKKLATLLMLGRSFNVHVILSQQRADAQYFGSARDNFNLVVGLGNLSEESKNMLFHSFKEKIKPDRKQGTGYIIQNGSNLESIIVPRIRNTQKLHECIKSIVNYT